MKRTYLILMLFLIACNQGEKDTEEPKIKVIDVPNNVHQIIKDSLPTCLIKHDARIKYIKQALKKRGLPYKEENETGETAEYKHTSITIFLRKKRVRYSIFTQVSFNRFFTDCQCAYSEWWYYIPGKSVQKLLFRDPEIGVKELTPLLILHYDLLNNIPLDSLNWYKNNYKMDEYITVDFSERVHEYDFYLEDSSISNPINIDEILKKWKMERLEVEKDYYQWDSLYEAKHKQK